MEATPQTIPRDTLMNVPMLTTAINLNPLPRHMHVNLGQHGTKLPVKTGIRDTHRAGVIVSLKQFGKEISYDGGGQRVSGGFCSSKPAITSRLPPIEPIGPTEDEIDGDLVIVEEPEKVVLYPCFVCDEEFERRSDMITHHQTKHTESDAEFLFLSKLRDQI